MELALHPPRWTGLEDLRPTLRTHLRRQCRDASELEDVVQETLLRAARYRGSLADPRNLRCWTLRIAVNVMRDRVRREARALRAESNDDGLDRKEGREPIPGEFDEETQLRVGDFVVDRRVALRALAEVLEELRADDRAVLCAFYRGRQDCAITAAECGIAANLVKVRLFRARRRLQRAMHVRLAGLSESQREYSAPDGELELAAAP